MKRSRRMDVMTRECSMHGRDENAYRSLVRKHERRYHSGDVGINCRIILKCFSNVWDF
jgi:hypothetical protein